MPRSLSDAARSGDLKAVIAYLDAGTPLDTAHQGTGRTALTEAVISGHQAVVEALVTRGADVNHRDKLAGFTPLAWAVECNHPHIAEYLIRAGADVNLASKFNLTPLMVACMKGSLPLVRQLLQAGASTEALTCAGKTALALAQEKRRDEVIALLKEQGATPGRAIPEPKVIPWPTAVEECDYTNPNSVLCCFIRAMNQFETQAAALHKGQSGPGLNERWRQMQASVFNLYCTPKARPFGRGGGVQVPPGYSLDDESLLASSIINSRRVELLTRNKRRECEFLYVLLKRRGRWLVDSRKCRLIGASWRKYFL